LSPQGEAAIYTICRARGLGGALPGNRKLLRRINAKKSPEYDLSPKFSYLSYAFIALLRRNNIAFQAGQHPYFAASTIHRR
jgi:hypothetical protein